MTARRERERDKAGERRERVQCRTGPVQLGTELANKVVERERGALGQYT